jgi:hypothetical protein
LSHDGVLGIAQEGLDLEVLLYPPKEDLDLPAFFIDIGDGLRRKAEVIR